MCAVSLIDSKKEGSPPTCSLLPCVYFQVNNGIWSFLDYVEDIATGRPLRLSSNLYLKPFAFIVTCTSFLMFLHTLMLY